jgi:hypothetical protein
MSLPMKYFYQTVSIITFSLMLSLNLHAESKLPVKKTALNLSTDIKSLLQQEMQLLQHGMQDLVPAIISGDNEKITAIAQKMQQSYLLKKKLTQTQRQALHNSLSSTFLQLDQDFHRLAGMLAHVSEKKKTELVSFYFYKLTEACVQCHQEYAQQRFPTLRNARLKQSHDH